MMFMSRRVTFTPACATHSATPRSREDRRPAAKRSSTASRRKSRPRRGRRIDYPWLSDHPSTYFFADDSPLTRLYPVPRRLPCRNEQSQRLCQDTALRPFVRSVAFDRIRRRNPRFTELAAIRDESTKSFSIERWVRKVAPYLSCVN